MKIQPITDISRMSREDYAHAIAVRIVQTGAGILLPVGTETEPVAVSWADRMALVRLIEEQLLQFDNDLNW